MKEEKKSKEDGWERENYVNKIGNDRKNGEMALPKFGDPGFGCVPSSCSLAFFPFFPFFSLSPFYMSASPVAFNLAFDVRHLASGISHIGSAFSL